MASERRLFVFAGRLRHCWCWFWNVWSSREYPRSDRWICVSCSSCRLATRARCWDVFQSRPTTLCEMRTTRWTNGTTIPSVRVRATLIRRVESYRRAFALVRPSQIPPRVPRIDDSATSTGVTAAASVAPSSSLSGETTVVFDRFASLVTLLNRSGHNP